MTPLEEADFRTSVRLPYGAVRREVSPKVVPGTDGIDAPPAPVAGLGPRGGVAGSWHAPVPAGRARRACSCKRASKH